MGTNIMRFLLLLLIHICLHSCGQVRNELGVETYDQYRTQKIEYRDSLLVFYTIKAWNDSNWYVFEDVSRMSKATNDQIEYFNGGVFYSPDRLKMIVWVGEKTPNAETWAEYNKEKPSANRICPQGKDTFYSLSG